MNCSICRKEIIEDDRSVSGFVHKANPMIPLIDQVERACYGRPVPKLSYEELQDQLDDANSYIIRLSHLLRDYMEGA
jgi:hypothetical protein